MLGENALMASEGDIFEIIYSLRSMRRLKKDPVPIEMVEKILDAGIQAPSGINSQPWAFVVITDPEKKKFFGERYDFWLKNRFGDGLLELRRVSAQSLAEALLPSATPSHAEKVIRRRQEEKCIK